MYPDHTIPLTLLTIALLSGCAATLPNASLSDAHERYNNARSNPDVTNLAAVELNDASASLDKADRAYKEDDSDPAVDHLAYMAKQQVGIAEQTAQRKSAELAVNNAGTKRDAIRLEARTAEADSANRQVVIAHENAERDQAIIREQEQQLKELNAQQTERGLLIVYNDVLFRTNQAQLGSKGIHNLEKLYYFLNQYGQYHVLIEGHTDSVGSNDANLKLSHKRANAVHDALVEMGIDHGRMELRDFGEESPIASNANGVGRQLNRRVEIYLSK